MLLQADWIKHGGLFICKYCLAAVEELKLAKRGLKCITKTQTYTQTRIHTQMCMSTRVHSHTHTHTLTQKQHASLQDECKRFIFRPLGPLLCSGFTERMKELPCPLLACMWGWGFYYGPKQGACVSVGRASVGQCEDGVQQNADGCTVAGRISVFSATKHSIHSEVSA